MLFYCLFLTFITLVLAVQAADPSINTPASLVECQPALLTWTASNLPVWISIIPGGMPGAPPLKDMGKLNGTSTTWIVDISKGTSITVQIRDSVGALAFSAPVTIQSSSNSSCIHK
ncbi:unnamed protein product [Rhizoctonia solani]|uniref:Secreted protein n=3 Tax=Rhizoctonia solani TaxID=456999 RepID=A0A8H3BVW5_9AGAM|nr:secreted protein, putative [Rhizoctonia solani AG-3 Rhs1AP]KEP52744.1 putative secreted protein [Rhizoctonia solani 123E]CAE6466820.1 unnamed protein product [Rhizoctonia solani]CAE6505791.1 unnamed protein product [Rhizoctonia solani]